MILFQTFIATCIRCERGMQLHGRIVKESGKPADVIVNTAAREKAGMIVLGSRGLGRLKRTFTSSSVSDHVLHRAKCPVVICRAAASVNVASTSIHHGNNSNSSNNSL